MPDEDNPKRKKGSASYHRRFIVSLIFLALGIILIPVGASLLQPRSRMWSTEIDYTDCISYKSILDARPMTCLEYWKTHDDCVCHTRFKITEPFMGDDIILYYELESYDQTAASYEKSRDDQQLSGHLSPKPAEQCGLYSYDEAGKPIAPCGKIADSMFTDFFSIRQSSTDTPLRVTYHGMIKDKGIYRNPKRNKSETLENVFKDYAKPKSWKKNIWELDTKNKGNNGFENEQFIGWMNTSMKRKPYFRLKQNKLKEGPYVLLVMYNYPPSMYNGTRKAILVATAIDTCSYFQIGVFCVATGSLALVLGAMTIAIGVRLEGLMFLRKKNNTNS